MRKTVKLTEASIRRIVRKLIKEQVESVASPESEGWRPIEDTNLSAEFIQQVEPILGRPPRFFADGEEDDMELVDNISQTVGSQIKSNYKKSPIIAYEDEEYGESEFRVTVVNYNGQTIAHCFDMSSPTTYDFYVM